MATAERMTAAAWWALAVIGMSTVLAAILLASDPTATDLVLGFSGIALLVLGWFVFGHPRAATEDSSTALIVVVAVAAGLAVAGAPSLAIVQAVVYPMAWVFCGSIRRAIVNNLIVAVGVTIGFLVSLGIEPQQLSTTALTMTLSLGFSIAMGLWISRTTALGEERGRLLAELQGAQSEIAALNRDAGAGAERERLARELHDTIAQDLTGLVMLAQRARRERGTNSETLKLLEESARGALAETRALVAGAAAVTGVAPDGSPATDVDLVGALERLADRFSRETGVAVGVTASRTPALGRDAEVVVLRCAQEALANARKHARASRVSIVLEEVDGRARLTVSDDGTGFDPASAGSGFGLPGMADRLALVHGSLRVDSAPGRGATLVAEVPLTVPAVSRPAGARESGVDTVGA